MRTAIQSFFTRPGAAQAIASGDRQTALAIAAQPDLEAHAPLVDSLLAIEAERDKHKARTIELANVVESLREVEKEIGDKWAIEQARRDEYDRGNNLLIEARVHLQRRQGSLGPSPKWLLAHIPPAVQQRLDSLGVQRAEVFRDIARLKSNGEQAASALHTARRNLASATGDCRRVNSAHHRAELSRSQKNLEAMEGAEQQRRDDLAGQQSAAAKITAEIDSMLANIKAGK